MQAIIVWSVKTRRAPSRRCRDARVYGHTTTAMHDMTILFTPRAFLYEVLPVVQVSSFGPQALPARRRTDSVLSVVYTTVPTCCRISAEQHEEYALYCMLTARCLSCMFSPARTHADETNQSVRAASCSRSLLRIIFRVRQCSPEVPKSCHIYTHAYPILRVVSKQVSCVLDLTTMA